MNMQTAQSLACCAFCHKSLPIVNGRVAPWRAPNGQFFCDEFCADDAEEERFSHRVNRVTLVMKTSV